MNELTRIDQAAVEAHRAGTTWANFWEEHRRSVSEMVTVHGVIYNHHTGTQEEEK